MGKQVYLAARYSRWQEMREVAERLELLGHTVTSRWVQGNHQCNDDQLLNEPGWALRFAQEDLEDLVSADTFVLFTDPLRTPTRGGKQVELGVALGLARYLGWNMQIIVVGQPENVFQWLPEVERVPDLDALLALLGSDL